MYQFVDIWVVSTFFSVVNDAARNIHVPVFLFVVFLSWLSPVAP